MIHKKLTSTFYLLTRTQRNLRNYCSIMATGKPLKEVVDQLECFAPLNCAEKWDNVGLLIEPNTARTIKTILLTNDLTEPVLKEALEENAELIISYHPPIFAPLKRITQSNWKERIVSICLENKIALYSPHTAWDFVRSGVNDWVASSFPYSSSIPIQEHPDKNGGMGRLLTVRHPLTLKDAIEKIKQKTEIKDVRVGVGNGMSLESNITQIAVCAGSGGSVFGKVPADLYVTGEMSHHEILDATQRGVSVIICNHSNSERGYLKEFKIILSEYLSNDVHIVVSKLDEDPLKTF